MSKYEICEECTNKDRCPLAILAEQNAKMLVFLRRIEATQWEGGSLHAEAISLIAEIER